jgi:hypothetical protein
MSNDALVCKLVEFDNMNKEINRAYIFYDHNLMAFGIRGGYISKGRKDYSFYTDSVAGVKNFIQTLFDKFHKLTVCLMKYSDLPSDSDDITYTLLLSYDGREYEIVGFDFWKDSGDTFSDKKNDSHIFNLENGHVSVFLDRSLQSLVDVYNDY